MQEGKREADRSERWRASVNYRQCHDWVERRERARVRDVRHDPLACEAERGKDAGDDDEGSSTCKGLRSANEKDAIRVRETRRRKRQATGQQHGEASRRRQADAMLHASGACEPGKASDNNNDNTASQSTKTSADEVCIALLRCQNRRRNMQRATSSRAE